MYSPLNKNDFERRILWIKIKSFILAIIFCFAYTFQASLIPINAQSRVKVVQCSKSYNKLSKTASQNAKIIKRTGEIAVPGSTFTVTRSYAVTVSNSATIDAIPEFLSLGYERSYQAGTAISWSKTNTTNRNLELVVKAFYDTYNVTSFKETSPGSGSCTIEYSTRTIYKGWGYDLS